MPGVDLCDRRVEIHVYDLRHDHCVLEHLLCGAPKPLVLEKDLGPLDEGLAICPIPSEPRRDEHRTMPPPLLPGIAEGGHFRCVFHVALHRPIRGASNQQLSNG